MDKLQQKILLALFIMCIVSPIGVLLPIFFNTGDAWGEWSAATLHDLLGYVPAGLAKYAGVWKATLSDYTLNENDTSTIHQSGYYIISAIFGTTLCYSVMVVISKLMLRNGK